MQVTMKQNRFKAGGVLMAVGSTQDLPDDFAQDLVRQGAAAYVTTPAAVDFRPDSPSTSGAVLGGALLELINMQERAKLVNPRDDKIPVVIGAVGAVTPTAGQVAVYTTGFSLSGNRYVNEILIGDGWANSYPANAAANVEPAKCFGALPRNGVNGGVGTMSFYTKNQVGQISGGSGKFRFATCEPMPAFTIPSAAYLFVRIEDESGWRELSAPLNIGLNTDGIRTVQFDFSQLGGTKMRIIEFVCSTEIGMRGVRHRPEYQFGSVPDLPLSLMITDSLGGTVVNGSLAQGAEYMSAILGDLLGNPHFHPMIQGGSGYIAVGNPALEYTAIQRVQLAYDMGLDPAEIIFECGTNDMGQTDAAIQAAVSATYQLVIDRFPRCESIISIAPFSGSGPLSQARAAEGDALIEAVVMGLGDKRIEHVSTMNLPNPYLTGSGNTSTAAASWTGNANRYYEGADTIHWNVTGNEEIARRLAVDIAAARYRIARRMGLRT